MHVRLQKLTQAHASKCGRIVEESVDPDQLVNLVNRLQWFRSICSTTAPLGHVYPRENTHMIDRTGLNEQGHYPRADDLSSLGPYVLQMYTYPHICMGCTVDSKSVLMYIFIYIFEATATRSDRSRLSWCTMQFVTDNAICRPRYITTQYDEQA